MEPGRAVGSARTERGLRVSIGRHGRQHRRRFAMDHMGACREKRALDAVCGDLRWGKNGLLRMRGESREVRDRVHEPLVLPRQQQQRKHGETDGTTHGVRGFGSQETEAIVGFGCGNLRCLAWQRGQNTTAGGAPRVTCH